MKTAVIVYTSMGGLVNTMKSLMKEKFPDWKIVNIADDSLIRDVMAAGKVTDAVKERLMGYFSIADGMKPEFIVSACSSVGEVAEYADAVLETPIVRIDKAMIERALETGSRIGVLASLETTMEPTRNYVLKLAKDAGKEVSLCCRVADGAYQANSAGNTELHDKLILEAAEQIKNDVDVIILAQGSMSKLQTRITEVSGLPTFGSPALCVESLAAMYKGENEA